MRTPLTLVAAFALALSATVEAKELQQAQICGQSGCIEIADPQRLEQLPLGAVAAPPAGPFYVLSYTVSAGRPVPEYFAMYYIRSRRLLAANGATPGSLTWLPATQQAIEALEAAVAGIEPFPPPSAWPAELKSPTRVALTSDDVQDGPGRNSSAWPLVSSSFVAALLLGLGSFAILRRLRRYAPFPPDAPS